MHGQPIKEVTGMSRWISDCEEQMGFKDAVKPSMAKRVVRAAMETFNPRMNSTSRPAGGVGVDVQVQQLHYLQELQRYNSNPEGYNAMVRSTQRGRKAQGGYSFGLDGFQTHQTKSDFDKFQSSSSSNSSGDRRRPPPQHGGGHA